MSEYRGIGRLSHRAEAPVVASTAARPRMGWPLMLSNSPPTISRLLSGESAKVITWASADAVKGIRAPVEALSAASRWRGWPFTWPKLPPRYTAVGLTARARTRPETLVDFQGRSALLAVEKAATFRRLLLSMTSKSPPM